MTKIQELRQLAHTIKTETQVGGNTADRVGSAFEGVADALEGTEQIAEMDKAVQEVQQQVDASKAQIQSLVNALPVVQQTGDSTTSVMSQKAISDKLNAVDTKFTEEKNRVDAELGKKFNKESVVQESGKAEDKVMSQKAVSIKLNDLSNKVKAILGTEEKILYENLELGSFQSVQLPTDISDNALVQISLLTTGITAANELVLYTYNTENKEQTYKLKYNFPISILYKECRNFKIYFHTLSKINVKVKLLATNGLLKAENRLLFQGCYPYTIDINYIGLKIGEQLLLKNVVTPNTKHPVQFYVYKNNIYDGSAYIVQVAPNNETILTITEDVEKYIISLPYSAQNLYDSVVEAYLILSSNELTNQIISQPLSEYDFIASGDSITAWDGTTSTGVQGVKRFEGWANLLNAQIGFKTYKNIAVPGAGYTQSSVYGSTLYSINRAIKEGLPEGFEGIFTMMGGTNDYDGKKSLGTANETMAKTYEELDQKNSVSNFDTICDGFRYCLETAIKRCSWRARIFVMTCVPRNDKQDYFTVAEMNEQIKLISRAFNVPVLDLFSELNFRNGLDKFGGTWKLSENPENVHPNAEAQKMMMRFVFGKIVTYIR